MLKFLKIFFLPSKENKFYPTIIHPEALILYTILFIFVFFLSFPITEKRLGLIANLTQDLIIREINPIRSENGFLILRSNEKLTKAAQLKAEDMVKRDYFSHFGPEGELPWEWIDKTGYDYAVAGENLAIDCASPRALVDALINSPSHAKNILNSYFRDIGVGIAKGEIGGRKTTVVVIFLGREIDSDIQVSLAVSEKTNDSPIKKPEIITDSQELSKEIPADEFVIHKRVEEEVIEQENVFLLAMGGSDEIPNGIKKKESDIKIFLVSNFFFNARTFITIFFSILIIWILSTFILIRNNPIPRIISSLVIVGLIFLLWIFL